MDERIIFHVDVNNAFLSWSAVLLLKNGCKLENKYLSRIEKFFPFKDKDNCKRVYKEIRKIEKEEK